MLRKQTIERFCVKPGTKVRLKQHDTSGADAQELKGLDEDDIKERAKSVLEDTVKDLEDAQEMLYADDRYSLLLIFQAMDAAGKDGTIEHVMSGVGPQACQVYAFKVPSDEELDHTFLWRCMIRLPERGRIGIFNRSYYEEVLVVRVHPEFLEHQKLPRAKPTKSLWKQRYSDINAFERHLVRNGTVVLKFFLHVSKEEQKRRFLERLERTEKQWKFSARDVAERDYWDDYMKAYESALSATSTEWAPWYIVPADHKPITRAIVADIITSTLHSLDLRYPELSDEERKALAEAKKKLENE